MAERPFVWTITLDKSDAHRSIEVNYKVLLENIPSKDQSILIQRSGSRVFSILPLLGVSSFGALMDKYKAEPVAEISDAINGYTYQTHLIFYP